MVNIRINAPISGYGLYRRGNWLLENIFKLYKHGLLQIQHMGGGGGIISKYFIGESFPLLEDLGMSLAILKFSLFWRVCGHEMQIGASIASTLADHEIRNH